MTHFTRLKKIFGERLDARTEENKKCLARAHSQDLLLKDSDAFDMEQLRKSCWLGIPSKSRPTIWRILSGYAPINNNRRIATLREKRQEYWLYVKHYFHLRKDEVHQGIFRQIHIDILRMCPLHPIFEQEAVQKMFERLLFILAVRFPDIGYVQGINELATPFFIVFISEHNSPGTKSKDYSVNQISNSQLRNIEADTYWCISSLLTTIYDDYIIEQPGIHVKVQSLKEIVSQVDGKLYDHLERNGVEFLLFAFRWMHNMLIRELPLDATIRLWDTYLSEEYGFSQFHIYVCGAFLRHFSKQLLRESDFSNLIMLLQNLPAQNWGDRQISELTANALSLMQSFRRSELHCASPTMRGLIQKLNYT